MSVRDRPSASRRHVRGVPRGRRGDPASGRCAWNVYGKDIERVGREGRPERVDVPAPRADQLLIRVDAVGLCFSDVKLIRLGGDHPSSTGAT